MHAALVDADFGRPLHDRFVVRGGSDRRLVLETPVDVHH